MRSQLRIVAAALLAACVLSLPNFRWGIICDLTQLLFLLLLPVDEELEMEKIALFSPPRDAPVESARDYFTNPLFLSFWAR